MSHAQCHGEPNDAVVVSRAQVATMLSPSRRASIGSTYNSGEDIATTLASFEVDEKTNLGMLASPLLTQERERDWQGAAVRCVVRFSREDAQVRYSDRWIAVALQAGFCDEINGDVCSVFLLLCTRCTLSNRTASAHHLWEKEASAALFRICRSNREMSESRSSHVPTRKERPVAMYPHKIKSSRDSTVPQESYSEREKDIRRASRSSGFLMYVHFQHSDTVHTLVD